jgi:uncharacterized protein (DUF1800 family)
MIEHILRRMGFGASPEDLSYYADLSPTALVNLLLNYEQAPDDVDAKIGGAPYVGITTRGTGFSPDTVINDTRQRWLFRMVHTQRPLQEKLALFWHNHFATAYSKVAGAFGAVHGAKMMDASPKNFGGAFKGQIHLFREMATGNFRDLLVAVAKDPAMLVWLDGRTNTRTRPQENFGRELMELFTTGIGHYTEQDVYAAARVFTGWNLTILGNRDDQVNSYYQYLYQPNQHDTAAKEFTFPIYPDGGRTIPARSAAQGEQDGIDLISALALHPATARRLATRLWKFFVNDVSEPDQGAVEEIAQAYLASNGNIKATLQKLLLSGWFLGGANIYQRYAWPVEYVVRTIKEMGWRGLSVDAAMTPLVNMGQQLYEPPDVNGWEAGPGWFSTSSMLARMNFSSTVAANQRFNLARDAQAYRQTPDQLMSYLLSRFPTTGFGGDALTAFQEYLRSGGNWTGSDAQLNTKVPGLSRLIVGSGEYQFI